MLDKFADAFYVDGSLRDIIVSNTTIDDWEKLYDELKAGQYDLTYECGGSHSLAPNVREIFVKRGMHDTCPALSLKLGANTLNCFFRCEEEIEFDLAPRDVSSEEEVWRITDFMRTVGKRLGKDVCLTEENAHDFELIRYRHEEDDIVPGSSLNTREPFREATPEEIADFLSKLPRQGP
jgi:hypothetical protein